MAAVEVTISGVLYDKLARTTRPVVLIGEATLTGLGVGGGPMPPGSGSPGDPPGIWGGPIDPYPDHGLPPPTGIWPPPGRPTHPIAPGGPPPGIWPGPGPLPGIEHPIVIPPENVPPDFKPPEPPAPGSPTTPVPPPAGSGGWPVNPMTPPAYLVVNYPGIGPVYVAQPAHPPSPTPTSGDAPSAPGRRG